jgi:hypothetical protein
MTDIDRFFVHVQITDCCWLWLAAKDKGGYGQMRIGDRMVYVHRFSFEQFVEPLIIGNDVLHHCDNTSCVRPDHLFQGDDQDNATDRVNKNRGTRGITVPSSKLTEDRIRIIRSSSLPENVLAKAFGVSHTAINRVRHRITWKHVV